MVAEAGLSACYVSGAAVSACMGLPDVGVIGLNDFSRVIKEVVTVSGLPCIADADTGFGEAEMVRRTVYEYNAAGAAGFHIEDQCFPKRCGHLSGKSLVTVDHMCDKVKSASLASVDVSNGDFIVCARTDARSAEGLEEAIERAKQYVLHGADMIFPEGLQSQEEFEQFSKAMKTLNGPSQLGGPYLLANITEFGQSPILTRSQLEQMGYNIVIFPVTTLRSAMKPVQDVLAMIHQDGTPEKQISKMYTRKDLYSSLQYVPGVEWRFPSATNS